MESIKNDQKEVRSSAAITKIIKDQYYEYGY